MNGSLGGACRKYVFDYALVQMDQYSFHPPKRELFEEKHPECINQISSVIMWPQFLFSTPTIIVDLCFILVLSLIHESLLPRAQVTPVRLRPALPVARCSCWVSSRSFSIATGATNRSWTACCGKWTLKKFRCTKMRRKTPAKK